MNTKLHAILLTILALFTVNSFAQNGLDFDGSDDRIDCGNDTSVQISGKAITLEAWIYPTTWKTNVYDGNVINKENNTNNYGYMLRVGAGGKLNFAMGNGSWNELTSANTVLSLNQWQHIAGTYDGAKMRIYVNGICTDSQNTTITLANTTTTNLALGYNATYGRYYQGMMDEVRIWNVTRTQSQLYNNMNLEFCSPQQGLRAYYKFNQGKAGGSNTSVKTLIDVSGYNNTGTLVAFSLSGSSSNWLKSKSFSKTIATSSFSATACDSYNSPTGKYKWTKTGVYNDTFSVGAFGCDSIVTVNLTIKKSSTRFISAFACGSYKSPSGLYTWTKSGTYKETLKNYLNCDSLVTVLLKIGGSTDSVGASACKSYKSPKGKTYTVSGMYYDTLLSYRGCDSIIKTNLTILPSSSITLNEKACKKYFSPSGKYVFTQNGTFRDTLKNYLGCDSLITINLKIMSSSGTAAMSSCKGIKSPSGKYTWNTTGTYKDTIINTSGCDSFVTVNFTRLQASNGTASINSCGPVRGPGKKRLWKVSGIYKDTLTNYRGCDSFLTVNVSIHRNDKGISLTGSTLTAANPKGTYRWLNCSQGMAVVSGATGKTFKPSVTGDYAVELTDSGCVDTSDCMSVNVVSVHGINGREPVSIHPNPNNGQFIITLPAAGAITRIRITDISGKVLYDKNFTNTSVCSINETGIETTGIYMVEVITASFRTVQKINIQR